MNATNPAGSPSATHAFQQVSDEELLATTRRLVGASNQLLASLLAHLAEVEERGLHRVRACSSLYTYCIYELRFSEDAAFRRVSAARLVKRFPALFEAIATGELHLTAVLMLGSLLTQENVDDVLARAKHRTKREVAQLVRQLDPLPDVPTRIEPLGPGFSLPKAPTLNPSWAAVTRALNPVRHLDPGERPRDWMDESPGGLVRAMPDPSAVSEPAPARVLTESTQPPQRYSVQFTATSEHVELVERAKALLAGSREGKSVADVYLRALRDLVAKLENRKYGSPPPLDKRSTLHVTLVPPPTTTEPPRQRGRYIPAAVRREVFERDAARCSFVDASGQRCRETHTLELHHRLPFARNGRHHPANLTLRCRAHNALAAEQDFGREFTEQSRNSQRHASLSSEAANAEHLR